MEPQKPKRLQHSPWPQERPRPAGPQSVTALLDGVGDADAELLRDAEPLALTDGDDEPVLDAEAVDVSEGDAVAVSEGDAVGVSDSDSDAVVEGDGEADTDTDPVAVDVVAHRPYWGRHVSGLQYSMDDPQKPKRLQHRPAPQERPRPEGPQSVMGVEDGDRDGDGERLHGVTDALLDADADADVDAEVVAEVDGCGYQCRN